MSVSIIQLVFYFGLGVVWNFYRPMNMDPLLLRRALTALLFSVLIPAYALLWLWNIRLDYNLLKFVLIGLFSVLINFLVVWFALKNKRWPNIVKGSMLIALSFSAVFTLGMPLVSNVVGGWSAKLSLEMLSLVVMPLIFSLGVMIAYRFSEKKQQVPARNLILKQPIFWLPLIGLVVNVADVPQPLWLKSALEPLVIGLVPLMLFTAGLAMRWQRSWTRIALKIWPYMLIPLLITPLAVWGSVLFLGGYGPKTFMAMMFMAVMPGSLLGFYICEQYRLELATYHIAYTLSMVLTIIVMPMLYLALQQGLIKP
jgi:predicted permease